MTDLDPWYEARDHMVEAVIADLYGSAADDELTEAPLERYIIGILHPRSVDGSQDTVEVADETPGDEAGTAPDGDSDPGVSFAHLRYPCSIGLTFGLADHTRLVTVRVEADRYEPDNDGGGTDRTTDPDEVSDNHDGPGVGSVIDAAVRTPAKRGGRWRRVHVEQILPEVAISAGSAHEIPIADGLVLRVVPRPARDGVINMTMVLINTLIRPEKGPADGWCWFRPSIAVHAVDGEFADRRPARLLTHMDADERSGELLYRDQRHLAVGHGVAVTWDEGAHVTRVETTFFPRHDLHLAQAERDDVGNLAMTTLGGPAAGPALARLVDRYEQWIATTEHEAAALTGTQADTSRTHFAAARTAVERMRRGIALLGSDDRAAEAFAVMNQVMREQRIRQEMVRRGLQVPPDDVEGVWRPFQIAFVLLNLEGLADPTSADRDLADLLWFPTGGGKTEAYLGLIAFSLVHRRLRGAGARHNGAGVGVIMRYTLRLLTLQQFERAAGLVCALEHWRRSSARTEKMTPFSIGLWVGQGATPNSVKAAAAAIKKRRNGEDPGEGGDPVQLLRCPWCGAGLGPHEYHADIRQDRVVVRCPAAGCDFSGPDGLPVHLVDSDVYRERPSLVIGTVDKFAMLAWNSASGGLFGSGHDAPPDLIVQDELHLISGPLGTLVGLYETAVDRLATDRDSHARPKLVASTATIRRAATQVHAVFDRDSRQFPPPGIDARDSFFAVDAPAADKGTRGYVGLMAPSTSHASLLVRTYAAVLQGADDLDAPDDVKDAYWTLLGYFNSLRVLGAAYIQSIDDVRDRIKVVAGRNGTAPRQTGDPREMTSRKKSSEIPQELELLQTPYPNQDSPDIVLATNMISVGVDVDRLGLMAVMGQPQTTSEYIQATSRVGRKRPGLVFTLFNASRSRDLSHYESFTSYHRALYRQVEATGATPFAPRALDRGLHGLLVILARHLVSGAATDKSVSVPVDSDAFGPLIEIIATRAARVDPDTEHDVRDALDALVEEWTEAVEANDVQQYALWNLSGKLEKGLLIPAGSTVGGADDQMAETFPPSTPPWPTLTSLRNVDRESTLKIISTKRSKAVKQDGHS